MPHPTISMVTSNEPTTTACVPFNNPDADVILRSSDRVDFHVYKVILALASPVFKDMLSLPQPPSSATSDAHSASGLPIISLAERSATLHGLLSLCYPFANPRLGHIRDIAEALIAAQKYEMQGGVALLSEHLQSFAAESPGIVYAVACRCGLEEVASKAARIYRKSRELKLSADTRMPVKYLPEMDHMSAAALFRLLRFCFAAASEAGYELAPPSPRLIETWPFLSSQPFDSQSEHTDLVLEASDGGRFHAIGLLLSVASPVFSEIISQLPSTDATAPAGLRVVAVSEDGDLLRTILQFCYPLPDPDTSKYGSRLQELVAAAKKYQIARLTAFVKRICLDLAETDGLRAYLIAMRECWEEAAQEAARHAVYQRQDTYVPEMEDVSARAYYRLLQYRCDCLSAVDSVAGLSMLSERKHWSKATTYATGPRAAPLPTDLLALQTRFAMMTLVGGPPSRLCKTIAPAVLQGTSLAKAISDSDALAERLSAALIEIKL